MERTTLASNETYAIYKPNYFPNEPEHGGRKKVVVVEASTLAHTKAPKLCYNPQLLRNPEINRGHSLSRVQLEAIAYACQKHVQFLPNRTRAGYFIGDSTGLGKGRMIAGLCIENFLLGRKSSIWITLTTDLYRASQQDFKDIWPKMNVYTWCSKDECIPDFSDGTLIVTYSTLCSSERYKFLVRTIGRKFDGVLCFDECHRARGGTKTNVGNVILYLQRKLPHARVVYSSATAATHPSHMSYMVRLGLWGRGTAFTDHEAFAEIMEERGIGSMEALAVSLKQRGSFCSRQLSMSGVKHVIKHVKLTDEFELIYDDCIKLWSEILVVLNKLPTPKRNLLSRYWAEHQAFFGTLCCSSKINKAVKIARKEVKKGHSVVFGIQRTGEAKYLATMKRGNPLRAFSLARANLEYVFEDLLDYSFNYRYAVVQESGNVRKKLKRERPKTSDPMVLKLVDIFNDLKDRLPKNPIDDLIEKLGGPGVVAELTGRKHRQCQSRVDKARYDPVARKTHTTDRATNLLEMEHFQCARKRFAILSDACSTGISLHSDPTKMQNPPKRVAITLEVPWSAQQMMQQLGRTHRCNQAHMPKYIFLSSSVPGEERFVWTVRDRLARMTALTQGDRHATTTSLSSKLIDTEFGARSLKKLLSCLLRILPFPFTHGHSRETLDDLCQVLTSVDLFRRERNKFNLVKQNLPLKLIFNRILGIRLKLQAVFHDLFSQMMDHVIRKAMDNNTFNGGILDMIVPPGCKVQIQDSTPIPEKSSLVTIYAVEIDFGLSWKELVKIMSKKGDIPTFLGDKGTLPDRMSVRYVFEEGKKQFCYSPYNRDKVEISAQERLKYCNVDFSDAIGLWKRQFNAMDNFFCLHKYMNGSCNPSCRVGVRYHQFVMVSGHLNEAWNVISMRTKNVNPTITRLKPTNGDVIVGVVTDSATGLLIENDLNKLF